MKSTKPPVKKTIGSQIIQHNLHNQNSQQLQKLTQKGKDSQVSTSFVASAAAVTDTKTDPICDICAQNVPGPEREKIFAIGKCDHYSCYVCSARLRAICDQSECPICRDKLDNVVFTSYRNKPYEKFNLKELLYNQKFKIYFENESIKNAFDKLLKFECLVCAKGIEKNNQNNNSNNSNNSNNNNNKDSSGATDETKVAKFSVKNVTSTKQNLINPGNQEFKDVSSLKMHLNIAHKLKLCDLCLAHNKLFPFEYSYYDVMSLRKHMRDGEPKTSHRGHPNCELCHDTFFNTDELVQHMSREHFHCHLCGRHDSQMMIYFLDYENLRLHFKLKHFLCERDGCRHEQFTSAFDNRIDFQLHLVNVHGGSGANLSRSEARQQRTITLDSAPHREPTRSRQNDLPRNAAIVSTGTIATANNSRQQVPESILAQIRQQRLPSRSEFPVLGGDAQSSSSMSGSFGPVQVSQNRNNYPSLAQTSNSVQSSRSTTISQRLTAGPSHRGGSFVRSAGGGLGRTPDQLNEMEFPPLPEQPKPKGPKKSKANQQQHNTRAQDGILTLDQLISSSLSLSSRANNNNRNKANKSTRPSKQKPLKITL